MEIVIAKEVPAEKHKETTRAGSVPRKWLLTGEAPDGLNFRLFRSQYQEGENAFQSPRHHHAFQQIRWAESGSINFGSGQYIPEGDIAFFPRGTYYGPQVKDQGVSWLLQFGFGLELQSIQLYRAGIEKLRARGRIEDGTFIDVDSTTGEERRREPAEAITEELTGKKFTIPTAGYEAPILMHPQAYSYYEEQPGVELKHLGRFWDHAGPNADVRISMIRLSQGGLHRLGAERAQIAWSTSAGMKINGTIYPELTCLYSPRGEETAVSGADNVEVYVVEFPRLD